MDKFSALADPTRRHILEILAARGQLSASDIYGKFHVSHPAISQHLKVLRDTKLVQVEKHAQQRIYKINPRKMVELEVWINRLKKRWSTSFERLDELLEKRRKL
ncbi:winged helix-turn-helix transcriptional regulator [Candidatus Gottesmanbacteria bacterium]|nr:winged helix-turn-helix transcriptional regulator [Candidatus Gottesmanbacteria bacterium]